MGMAAHEGAIGQNTIVADDAIVGDVAVGHEEIAVTDARGPSLRRAPVNGNLFAEDIVVADLDGSRLVVVLHVLGPFAQHGPTKYGIAFAHDQGAA